MLMTLLPDNNFPFGTNSTSLLFFLQKPLLLAALISSLTAVLAVPASGYRLLSRALILFLLGFSVLIILWSSFFALPGTTSGYLLLRYLISGVYFILWDYYPTLTARCNRGTVTLAFSECMKKPWHYLVGIELPGLDYRSNDEIFHRSENKMFLVHKSTIVGWVNGRQGSQLSCCSDQHFVWIIFRKIRLKWKETS